jgi:hypothetical protein
MVPCCFWDLVALLDTLLATTLAGCSPLLATERPCAFDQHRIGVATAVSTLTTVVAVHLCTQHDVVGPTATATTTDADQLCFYLVICSVPGTATGRAVSA